MPLHDFDVAHPPLLAQVREGGHTVWSIGRNIESWSFSLHRTTNHEHFTDIRSKLCEHFEQEGTTMCSGMGMGMGMGNFTKRTVRNGVMKPRGERLDISDSGGAQERCCMCLCKRYVRPTHQVCHPDSPKKVKRWEYGESQHIGVKEARMSADANLHVLSARSPQ